MFSSRNMSEEYRKALVELKRQYRDGTPDIWRND